MSIRHRLYPYRTTICLTRNAAVSVFLVVVVRSPTAKINRGPPENLRRPHELFVDRETGDRYCCATHRASPNLTSPCGVSHGKSWRRFARRKKKSCLGSILEATYLNIYIYGIDCCCGFPGAPALHACAVRTIKQKSARCAIL